MALLQIKKTLWLSEIFLSKKEYNVFEGWECKPIEPTITNNIILFNLSDGIYFLQIKYIRYEEEDAETTYIYKKLQVKNNKIRIQKIAIGTVFDEPSWFCDY